MFPKIPYDERGKRFYYSCFFLTLFKFMSFLKRLSLGFAIFSLFTPLFFISTEVYAAPPSASSAAKFTIGERVQVSDGPLNVRAKASPSGKILGTQPTGALGTIVDGPKSSGGYKWWSVNYDTGADGWSAENYLISAVIALPSVPAYLFAAPGDTIVGLGWTASTGATSYTVKRSTTNGGPYTAVATGLTGTSHADTGLTNGTTYYYVVSAVNSAGESANSPEASATPVAPVQVAPSAPTNLTGTAGNTTASLSWSASSGATSYTVKRSTTNGGPYTAVATGLTGTSHADTGLTNGTTYYYVVSAVNADGESANSAQASATPTGTVENPVPVTYEAEAMTLSQYEIDPGYPQVIKVSSAYVSGNATQVFGGVTGTYDMQVYVLLENDGQSTLDVYRGSTLLQSYIYPLGTGNIASFTISKVSISNGETIRLFGQINAGAVARIDKIVLTPTSGVGEAPSVPANLTATAANGAAILSWNASVGAVSYSVKRATVSGGPYATVASNVTSTNHTDTGLTNGTTYYYVVSAVNSAGESANSSQVSVIPIAPVASGACVNPVGGYEGFGKNTTGGADQAIYRVTNLNNSGAGSLRDALSVGNRCVVFDVGGAIELGGELQVKSNVTVDGFTAPSPGITLRNSAIGVYNNNNVIIRGIRHRYAPAGIDGLYVYGAQNVVIDHVSVSNFGDGAVDVTQNSRDVTIQWSILAEGISGHNYISLNAYNSSRITHHHNLYMKGVDRQPMCSYDLVTFSNPSEITCDVRNNLIWGFTQWGTTVRQGAYANVVNNYYYGSGSKPLYVFENGVAYVNGNYSKNGTNVDAWSNRSTPFSAPSITMTDASTAASQILLDAGARSTNFGLDSVDHDYISQVVL